MWPRPPLALGSALGAGNPGANEYLLFAPKYAIFAIFSSKFVKQKMPRLNDIQNVFDGADLNENIDQNVEEIELEISPVNPEDF